MPFKVTLPVPATKVRQSGPSIVLEKRMFPPLLVKIVGTKTLTGLESEIFPFWVVSVPPTLTGPVPF